MAWQSLLAKAVMVEGSQAAVARKLGYSPATVSTVLAGSYNGNMAAVESKVMEIYGGKNMQGEEKRVPDGYMLNAVGHLVPIESIEEVDLARDEFVKATVEKAKRMSETIRAFKREISGDMQAFIEMSAEQYGADVGGERGNVRLTSYDGRFQVLRAVNDRLDFDERLQAAKVLVDECLREWSRTAGPELRTIVESAFQVDKKGKINTKRILGLRKLKIEHPTWKKAMEAISDAVTVVGSSTYYRVYERDEQGKYQQVALDFSGV